MNFWSYINNFKIGDHFFNRNFGSHCMCLKESCIYRWLKLCTLCIVVTAIYQLCALHWSIGAIGDLLWLTEIQKYLKICKCKNMKLMTQRETNTHIPYTSTLATKFDNSCKFTTFGIHIACIYILLPVFFFTLTFYINFSRNHVIWLPSIQWWYALFFALFIARVCRMR